MEKEDGGLNGEGDAYVVASVDGGVLGAGDSSAAWRDDGCVCETVEVGFGCGVS